MMVGDFYISILKPRYLRKTADQGQIHDNKCFANFSCYTQKFENRLDDATSYQQGHTLKPLMAIMHIPGELW